MFPPGFNEENITIDFEILPEIEPEEDLIELEDVVTTIRRNSRVIKPKQTAPPPPPPPKPEPKPPSPKPIKKELPKPKPKPKPVIIPEIKPKKPLPPPPKKREPFVLGNYEKIDDLNKSYYRRKRIVYGHRYINLDESKILKSNLPSYLLRSDQLDESQMEFAEYDQMIRPYAWNKGYSTIKVKQRLLDKLKIPVMLGRFRNRNNEMLPKLAASRSHHSQSTRKSRMRRDSRNSRASRSFVDQSSRRGSRFSHRS